MYVCLRHCSYYGHSDCSAELDRADPLMYHAHGPYGHMHLSVDEAFDSIRFDSQANAIQVAIRDLPPL